MKTSAAAWLLALLPLAVSAQAPDCRSGDSFFAAQADIDGVLSALRDDQPVSTLEARLTALGWPKARQSQALKQAFSSQAMRALQDEKHAHVLALTDAVMASSGPDARVSKCDAARQVRTLGGKVMDVNRRQVDHVARELGIAG